jgi:hypothetical protein
LWFFWPKANLAQVVVVVPFSHRAQFRYPSNAHEKRRRKKEEEKSQKVN